MKTKFPVYTLLMIVCSFWLPGCASVPERRFEDVDLLIDETAMPDGWARAELVHNNTVPEGQKSAAYIIFYSTETDLFVRGRENIYRYDSVGLAGRNYNRFESTYFNDASIYRTTPWQVPDGFDFTSTTADKSRFACAGSNFTTGPEMLGNNSTQCMYLAQYSEFLVFFSITTEIDGQVYITPAEIKPILEALDQKVNDHPLKRVA